MTRRLFFGFIIDNAIGHDLIAKVSVENNAATNRIRWTIDGNFHVTTHFLGDVDEAQIPFLIEALQAIAAAQQSISTTVEKIGFFPQYRSRLVAAYVENNTVIMKIYRELGAKLDQLDVHFDQKNYIPHITLARTIDKIMNNDKLLNNYKIELNQLALYESVLGKNGSQYIPISVAKFD